MSILQKEFYEKLKHNKIQISNNKNPIRMDLFLSFFDIDLIRSYDHLGICNGWTKLENLEEKLILGGGKCGGIEYLDTIQYKSNLQNVYNNYVNPFYLFGIINLKGQSFFLEYYKKEIEEIENKLDLEIKYLQSQINSKKEIKETITKEIIKHYDNVSLL